MMSKLSQWFWNEQVWLPPGYTWKSLTEATHFHYPPSWHVYTYPFFIAAVMLVLRYAVLYPFLFAPIGRLVGVRQTQPKSPTPNPHLQRLFALHRTKPPQDLVLQSAMKLGWSERQVERWLRQYGRSSRSSDVLKFCDNAWQLLYYTSYCAFGFYVLWDKSWLWDIRQCWYKFPEHTVSDDIWWYYMIGLSFYWSMTVSYFAQHHQSDAVQMFVHHVVTILLISFSWITNLVRMGSLVLLVHEVADIPMLMAKLVKLGGRRDLMDPLFAVFLVLWLVTRTGLFPFWILRSTLFEAHVILQWMYPIYYMFNGLLLSLLLMHLIWTFLIGKVLVRKFTHNEMADLRSSTDESEEELDESKKK